MRHLTLCGYLAAFAILVGGLPAASQTPEAPKRIIMEGANGDSILDPCCASDGVAKGRLSGIVLVQSEEETSVPSDPEGPDGDMAAARLSTRATGSLVKFLADADRTCKDMRAVRGQQIDDNLYRIDCYRVMYRDIAEGMSTTGEYAPIRRALLDASDKLDGIVMANIDADAPTVRVRERAAAAASATEPLRAIRKERQRAAETQAAAVLQETAIVILRAGEIPTRRTVHYARVSAAVEENLAVLRSA